MDESLLSIISVGCGQLAKMLIQPFWMDEALLSTSPASRGQVGNHMEFLDQICIATGMQIAVRQFGLSRYFSEMLITLKPHNIFLSDFGYLYIVTLSRQWSSDLYRLTLFGMLKL